METKIKTNQIDYDFNGGGGGGNAFYPHDHQELVEFISDGESDRIIDFSNFDYETLSESNGYYIENKNYTIRNLNYGIDGETNFPWFSQPLFEFGNNTSVEFSNCKIIIHRIDCNNPQDPQGIFKTNGPSSRITFTNVKIEIGEVSNNSNLFIIDIKDSEYQINYCDFFVNGQYDYDGDGQRLPEGHILKCTLSENHDGGYQHKISNSVFDINNFTDTEAAIMYYTIDNDYGEDVELYINYSNIQNIEAVNNMRINANFSTLGYVVCLEIPINDVLDWVDGDTYNEDQIIKWTNPSDSGDVKYCIANEQFTADGYDFDAYRNDGIIRDYFNISVTGKFTNMTNDHTVMFNISVDNFSTNNIYVPIQDPNLNDGNDTDIISAIRELAARTNNV